MIDRRIKFAFFYGIMFFIPEIIWYQISSVLGIKNFILYFVVFLWSFIAFFTLYKIYNFKNSYFIYQKRLIKDEEPFEFLVERYKFSDENKLNGMLTLPLFTMRKIVRERSEYLFLNSINITQLRYFPSRDSDCVWLFCYVNGIDTFCLLSEDETYVLRNKIFSLKEVAILNTDFYEKVKKIVNNNNFILRDIISKV